MVNKSGKLATLLFIGVTLLPLIALMVMDFQVKKANDITGSYTLSSPESSTDNMVGTAVVLCLLALIVLTFVVGKIRHTKIISTMPLAKINEDIKKIDEHLQKR